MFENESSIQIVGVLVSIVSFVIALCGYLISYIYKKHIQDNNRMFRENREDHHRLWDSVEKKRDK